MEKSKVYYTSMRTKPMGKNLLQKLETLIRTAGIGEIDFENKYTAIKLHFGEPGNLAFLRPNYAKVVADVVKSLGGKPFLTDCNTLYVGGRKNALDHLESAYVNGFSPLTTGCHVIIADGLKGTDESIISLEGTKWVKEAKIGRAVMDADVFISLSHFKGHEMAGFGGAIKNIGMGCGSRGGKMEMHSAGKPEVNAEKCVGCNRCSRICAQDAVLMENGKAFVDCDKCAGCGRCIGVCPTDAMRARYDVSNTVMNEKIAEYTKAVLDGRPHFHICLAIDISPFCDCHGENDVAIVPDVGMFASFDPVALDMACADAVNRQPVMQNSLLADHCHECEDHFTAIGPTTDWRSALTHSEALGIGTMEYELITVE